MIQVARVNNGTRTEFLDSLDGLTNDDQHTLWVDIVAPSADEMTAIDSLFQLDDAAIEDCLIGTQRPRIDDYERYFFVVLYGILSAGETEPEPRKLSVFWGDRFLVTIHDEPIPSINDLRKFLRTDHARISITSDYLFFELFDRMVDNYMVVVTQYERELEQLEDESLSPTAGESLLQRCSDLRGRIIRIRQLAVSKIELIHPLTDGRYDDISPKLSKQFLHVRDHLQSVVENVDRLRELINGARENYRATLAHHTNEIMRTLTTYAGILLPLSLIAGIYGMNLPVWPDPDRTVSFWIVLAMMGVIGVGSYIYFRTRRWL